MAKGKVRRVFPGGNTGLGFYSFYEYVAKPDANKIIVLKGGPGVGKSTFIKWIGEQLSDQGLDVEFHHCSGDVHGLDGLYVPAIDLAIVDGTSPHVIDPRAPGAVDEIIYLGDYWDEDILRRQKARILHLTAEASNNFRRAYRYLIIAKALNEEIEAYIQEANALDIAALNHTANSLVENLFSGVTFRERKPYIRHLFASAITHEGCINHFPTIFDDLKRRVILQGPSGSGRSTLVRKLMDAALRLGLDVEAYHDLIDPSRVEHIIIPELSTAVINGSHPHPYPGKAEDVRIDTSRFVDPKPLQQYVSYRHEANRRFEDSLQRSVYFLKQAKATHDLLETCYVPSMRFDEIQQLRYQTLDRILRLAPSPMPSGQRHKALEDTVPLQ